MLAARSVISTRGEVLQDDNIKRVERNGFNKI